MKHFLTTDPGYTIIGLTTIISTVLIAISVVGFWGKRDWSSRFDLWVFPVVFILLLTLACTSFVEGSIFIGVIQICAAAYLGFSWLGVKRYSHDSEM